MKRICSAGRAATVAALLVLPICLAGRSVAQPQPPVAISCEDLKGAMIEVLQTIEFAAGLDSSASDGVLGLDAALFDRIVDKPRFLAAARGIRRAAEEARSGEMPAPSPLGRLSGSGVWPPNYPPNTDLNFNILYPLGLIRSNSDRCGGTTFDYYVAAMAGAESAMIVAQSVCDVAGCDPTGIGCAIVCAAVKVATLAYKAAAVPIVACTGWGVSVDSAEIEAAYENVIRVLGDLSFVDDKMTASFQKSFDKADTLLATLTAHQAQLSLHDAEVKRMITKLVAGLVANQLEIIKLLKTPEGRRPGWGTEGY